MTLRWTPPEHPNGILTGYLLQYQWSKHYVDDTNEVKSIKLQKCHKIFVMRINQSGVENQAVTEQFWAFLRSVTESDDGPLQQKTIDDPTATNFTIQGLDRHRQYSFYLRGRTSAGDGEFTMMTGATTLEGGLFFNLYYQYSHSGSLSLCLYTTSQFHWNWGCI